MRCSDGLSQDDSGRARDWALNPIRMGHCMENWLSTLLVLEYRMQTSILTIFFFPWLYLLYFMCRIGSVFAASP